MYVQQRSDMKETRFLIPRNDGEGLNYAKLIENYLELVKLDLGITTSRMWFTGRNNNLVSSFMGKNTISKVIKEKKY